MEEESDAPVARLNGAQGKLLLRYHRYRNNVSHTDYSILLTLIFLLLARNLHDPTANSCPAKVSPGGLTHLV